MKKIKNEFYNEDLIKILSTLLKKKVLIIKTTLFFTLIGILYSFSLDNIYTASSTFYPHLDKNNSSQGLKNLAGIAGIAGINVETEITENIPPTLYPKIISSPQFKIEILDGEIFLNDNKLSFREYLLKKKNNNKFIKLLKNPFNLFTKINSNEGIKSKNEIKILKLSDEEYNLHDYLSKTIKIELNEKEGFINLSVKDNNPIIASQVAKKANEILQKAL